MGAKNSVLVYSQGNAREALKNARTLDRDASCKLVQTLFPGAKPRGESASLQWTYPPSGQIYVGCYPGVAIVASNKFALDYPSKIPAAWLAPGTQGTTYLHAMHSVVDWCAFGVWENGILRRSFSATPESGEPNRMILEDYGEKLPFELPFWAGEHPLYEDGEQAQDQPLKFDPMELGEAALFEFFGYQLEGEASELFDPSRVELMTFEIKPWWKFW